MAFFSARQMTYSDKSVTCVPGPCGAVCVSVQSSCVQCGLSAWFEIVAQVVTARDWGHLPFKNTGGSRDTRAHGSHHHTDVYRYRVPVKKVPVPVPVYTLRARSTPVALTLPHSSPATEMMFALCVSSHCFLLICPR